MSAATVHRRVRTGLWERLYPAVYLVGGHRLTDEERYGRRDCGRVSRRPCPARRRPTGTACWIGHLQRSRRRFLAETDRAAARERSYGGVTCCRGPGANPG